jgi:ferredoxin
MDEVVILDRRKQAPSSPKIPKTKGNFCIGCGVCVRVCPIKDINQLVEEEVFPGVIATIVKIPHTKRNTKVTIEGGKTCTLAEFCIKCRKCIEECPTDARTF